LALYDAFGGERTRAHHDVAETLRLAPHTAAGGLLGASTFLDAKTDDARLVLRVLHEAECHGARVVNDARVERLLCAGSEVVGARVAGAGFSGEVRARVVVNATGTWADGVRAELGAAPMLRPLRGSHLLFPLWRLPVAQSVSLLHPRDRRPVFATPWEGAALVGTTDLDHGDGPERDPAITAAEVTYLLEALAYAFPSLHLTAADAISSFAGVRPVVDAGAGDPSAAAREHDVRVEHGLITVTGGKLTTFRVIAVDALRYATPRLEALRGVGDGDAQSRAPVFAAVTPGPALARLSPALRQRLIGRYGAHAEALVADAGGDALPRIDATPTLWAELRWALRHEQVRHLDDLLLRRSRVGLLLRRGAEALLPQLQRPACDALGWSTADWRAECERYSGIIARCHSLP
jgi:glycerol-3-phosphate dehydrogenase